MGAIFIGALLGVLMVFGIVAGKSHILQETRWQCTASHREGPEHDQKDVCDQFSRKDAK